MRAWWTILLLAAACGGSGGAAVQVAAGNGHSCALGSSGAVFCWGDNSAGQLGNGATTTRDAPVRVSGLTAAAVQIAAGGAHGCALLDTGGLVCWGRNAFGQLGDGTTTPSSVPVAVAIIDDAEEVTAGDAHTCALRASSTVECWGSNAFGQLGTGSGDAQELLPAPLSLLDVLEVAAGKEHTCALRANGEVFCWGRDDGDGRLGRLPGDPVQPVPMAVEGLTDAVALALGDEHSCARRQGGAVACWGSNAQAQLGDLDLGPMGQRYMPRDVADIAAATAIDGGAFHTCAVVGDELLCWGFNGAGQLGNGTTDLAPLPVTVNNIFGVSTVAAGRGHTCAIEGTAVRCWGFNETGQVGDGSRTDRTLPRSVRLP
jgi:alpha-tubulin suppressor-like RCC1 family protein